MLRRSNLISILLVTAFVVAANAQTSIFTYQGRLADGATAANGTYQMQFSVWNALSGGTQQGSTITFDGVGVNPPAVSVVNGVFTVNLDFSPAGPFATGANRWLEIAVRKATDPPGFTTLTPRQQVTSTPFATRSSSTSNADSAINVSGVVAIANGGTGSTTKNFVDLSTDQTVAGNKSFTGAVAVTGGSGVFNGNGSGLTDLNGANITNNTINASALAADTFPNNQNLSRLGQLRWDLLGQRVAVGITPRGVAFDGANIWVANSASNNVTKLRASDGALQGSFAVGTAPFGVAFDGANIWVVNGSTNNVTKLRASDGACVGTCTFAVGGFPNLVAFDGANIWVANSATNNMTKLRASDGALQGTFAVGSAPRGVAFDGENIWVASNISNNVTKLRASDGACVATCTFAVGANPVGVAFDGANIWVANNGSSNVTKLRASDGACVGTCTFAVGTSPFAVAFDGANIWVANFSSNNVTKLRASDGALQGTFAAGTNSQFVAFDGANIWVTNSGSNNVVKLPVFP